MPAYNTDENDDADEETREDFLAAKELHAAIADPARDCNLAFQSCSRSLQQKTDRARNFANLIENVVKPHSELAGRLRAAFPAFFNVDQEGCRKESGSEERGTEERGDTRSSSKKRDADEADNYRMRLAVLGTFGPQIFFKYGWHQKPRRFTRSLKKLCMQCAGSCPYEKVWQDYIVPRINSRIWKSTGTSRDLEKPEGRIVYSDLEALTNLENTFEPCEIPYDHNIKYDAHGIICAMPIPKASTAKTIPSKSRDFTGKPAKKSVARLKDSPSVVQRSRPQRAEGSELRQPVSSYRTTSLLSAAGANHAARPNVGQPVEKNEGAARTSSRKRESEEVFQDAMMRGADKRQARGITNVSSVLRVGSDQETSPRPLRTSASEADASHSDIHFIHRNSATADRIPTMNRCRVPLHTLREEVDVKLEQIKRQQRELYVSLHETWQAKYHSKLQAVVNRTKFALTQPRVDDEKAGEMEMFNGLLAWLGDLKFARVGTDVDHAEDCDVLVLPANEFAYRTEQHGFRPERCVVIKEEYFNDADATVATVPGYLDMLQRRYGKLPFNVQDVNSSSGKPREMSLSKVVKCMKQSKDKPSSPGCGVNLLDLNGNADLARPRALHIPCYQVAQDHCASKTQPGKCGVQPTDDAESQLRSCFRFDILSDRDSFSGPHLDSLNGTWLRILEGVKAWMVAIDLTDMDYESWGNDDKYWCPTGDRTRIIMLEKGDVLWMPPGIRVVHSPYTLEPCLAEGGMMLDGERLSEQIANIKWIGEHHWVTNEDIPPGVFRILEEISRKI